MFDRNANEVLWGKMLKLIVITKSAVGAAGFKFSRDASRRARNRTPMGAKEPEPIKSRGRGAQRFLSLSRHVFLFSTLSYSTLRDRKFLPTLEQRQIRKNRREVGFARFKGLLQKNINRARIPQTTTATSDSR